MPRADTEHRESSWEQVGRTLQELVTRCHELGGRAESSWGEIPGKELAQTLRTEEALEWLPCDALMRALIRGGGISQPTSRQGYFCSMRCLCALDTLGIIHAELDGRAFYPEPPDGWSDV